MNNEPIVIAGCLVEKDNKFLLVQEAKPKAYGLWNTPAGHVDAGENIEQAAIRETKEESGFDVDLKTELGTYSTDNGHEIHLFSAEVVSGILVFPKDEILDARWLTHKEIEVLGAEKKLRGSYILLAIEEYLKIAS